MENEERTSSISSPQPSTSQDNGKRVLEPEERPPRQTKPRSHPTTSRLTQHQTASGMEQATVSHILRFLQVWEGCCKSENGVCYNNDGSIRRFTVGKSLRRGTDGHKFYRSFKTVERNGNCSAGPAKGIPVRRPKRGKRRQVGAPNLWHALVVTCLLSKPPPASAAPIESGLPDEGRTWRADLSHFLEIAAQVTPFLILFVGFVLLGFICFKIRRHLVQNSRPSRSQVDPYSLENNRRLRHRIHRAIQVLSFIAIGAGFAWWAVRSVDHGFSDAQANIVAFFFLGWTNLVALSCWPMRDKLQHLLAILVGGILFSLLGSALLIMSGGATPGGKLMLRYLGDTGDIAPFVFGTWTVAVYLSELGQAHAPAQSGDMSTRNQQLAGNTAIRSRSYAAAVNRRRVRNISFNRSQRTPSHGI
ncbi:hypothetical protein Q7P37_008837 [Cladosporium fusiforme]